MKLVFGFVPALLGVLSVLQMGFNKKISQAWGLPSAVLLNASVLLISATIVFFAVLKSQPEADLWKIHIDWAEAKWWFVLPGLMGLVLVLGGPWAVAKWGALNTFIVLVGAQLITSLLWDLKVEGLELNWQRIAGVALAWAGVFLATLAR